MNAQTKIEADPVSRLEAALAAVLPTLEGAKKNSNNPHFKSKYADLGSVIDAIRPAADHGIWFRQVLHEGERGVTIETLYTGFGATISAGTLFMPADKTNAQGYGSALTYARRYALQTAFGLSAEDDDGNAASRPTKPQETAPEPSISDDQLAQLKQLIPAAKLTPGQFCQTMKCKTVADLPASKFAEATERLNTRLAEIAKQESNKEAAGA